ncbi:hypothetical protein VDG1235_137 [Verrucomicrobiia bacterium DG1235]|nr:hypothetical protein VDG1235_137 [Verrucomicrobiae bacterium DG1235]
MDQIIELLKLLGFIFVFYIFIELMDLPEWISSRIRKRPNKNELIRRIEILEGEIDRIKNSEK